MIQLTDRMANFLCKIIHCYRDQLWVDVGASPHGRIHIFGHRCFCNSIKAKAMWVENEYHEKITDIKNIKEFKAWMTHMK